MAAPTPYNRSYSFSDYQANNPSQPLPGAQVDNELENIEQSLNGAIDALNDVRRADGALVNGIVTRDAMAPSALALFDEKIGAAEEAAGEAQASASAASNSAVAAQGSANQAASAQTGAQAARDAAANYASDAASKSEIIFASALGLSEITIPTSITAVHVNGYANPGDGGAMLLKEAFSVPAHSLWFPDAKGRMWGIVTDAVDLKEAGAKDDGSTDNYAALNRARSFLSGGGTIRLPGKVGSNYRFDVDGVLGGPYLGYGMTLDPDPGVVVSGFVYPENSIRTTRRIAAKIDDPALPMQADTSYVPDYARHMDEKGFFLSRTECEDVTYEIVALDGAAVMHQSIDWDADDAAASASFTSAGPNYATYTLSTTDWIGPMVPIKAGEEISACWTEADHTVGIRIRTFGEQHYLHTTANYAASSAIRATGGPTYYTSLAADWLGRIYDPAWTGNWGLWTVEIIGPMTARVLLNGYPIYTLTTATHILEAGFQALKTGASTSGTIFGMTKARRTYSAGSRISLLTIGDSKTEPQHGGWPEYAREMLEGADGVRVHRVVNIAVAGHTSADQLASLSAAIAADNPAKFCTDVAIDIGTNDIQFGVPITTTIANIEDIVDLCQGHSMRVTLCCPMMWFGKAQRPSDPTYGVFTSNGERAAALRLAVIQIAAAKGCQVVDIPRVTGNVLAEDVKSGGEAPARCERDYIHGTPFSGKIIGRAIAAAVLRGIKRRMSPAFAPLTVPSTLFTNGWSNVDAQISMDADGRVTFRGRLGVGTVTNDVDVLTLPLIWRPKATEQVLAITDGFAPILVQVGGDGVVSVFNLESVDSDATDLFIPTFSWETT